MSDTALFGPDPVNGRSKWNILEHTGPASYVAGGETVSQNVYGGPNPWGLAGYQFVVGGISYSGNYRVDCLYGGKGVRASVKLKWTFANSGGVGAVNTNAAGTGMTVGTVVPITFGAAPAGGTTATGTLTVLTATTYSYTITNPGSGYLAAPTATVAGTGGTPPTLTTTLSVSGQEPTGANLTGETVRLLPIGG